MKWRFIDTEIHSGAWNMAIDEAVMTCCAAGRVPPTLRFYRWGPPALTLGYFQKAERDVNFDACAHLGIDVVRRLTGGRAVLHDQELTYSIVMPHEGCPLPDSITDSYRVLSRGLAEGFRILDLPVTMSHPAPRSGKPGSSAACFDALSVWELEADGKKIVGSAQARRFGSVLQHGSVLNDLNPEMLFATMKDENPRRLERAKATFLEKATSIRHLTGCPLPWNELFDAFKEGFFIALERDLDAHFVEDDLTDDELSLAEDLIENKYATRDCNHRR